jgi:polysulfide reductase chain C
MTFVPVWGGIIACYLFLAGLGGGAFITASLVKKLHPEAAGVVRIGRIIAPIVVIVGLCLLMVDARGGLYNPLRFVFLLTNFGSVMTWGVVILAVFVLASLVVLGMDLFGKQEAPAWLVWVGNIFGILTAAYTGVLLGVINTFPLWNNALLPVLFVVSALSTGMAAVMFGALIKYPEQVKGMTDLTRIHLVLPALEIVLFFFLLFIVSHVSTAGASSVAAMVSGGYALAFWLGIMVVGLVIPLAIEIRALCKGTENRGLALAGDAGVLVGGYLVRYIIIVAALPVILF